MKPAWTGEAMSKLHLYSISQTEIANKIGCSREYVNGVLNGKHKSRKSKDDVEKAISQLIAERKEK